MPLYRFELSGNLEEGTVEVELPDDEAARFDALRAASESIVAGFQRDEAEWALRVFNEDGSVIAEITFRDVMARG